MSDNLVDTPYGNTGSMGTIDNALRGLIDWVSVTFRACRKWTEVARIIGLDLDLGLFYVGLRSKATFKVLFLNLSLRF